MSGRLFEPADEPPDRASGPAGPPEPAPDAPLAARMRPRDLGEFVGHAHLVGDESSLGRMLRQGELTSLILWGPPGSGKTSLAAVVAGTTEAAWEQLSAVSAGVGDVREVIEQARQRRQAAGRPTVLFLDEIHRFNKAQQDALLPAVESGTLTLLGATTENPFFALNAPLLSRCTLLQLEPLRAGEIETILRRAVADRQRGLGPDIEVPDTLLSRIASLTDGDARAGLRMLEVAARAARGQRGEAGEAGEDPETVELRAEDLDSGLVQLRYDRGDAHYDQASAFIKSLRGSDPDAAVYWLLRMLRAGEDPRFLARRMVILASEDIGLADPQALPLAVAAFRALEFVGLPEARYALVHAALALAAAEKSNAVARALWAGEQAVEDAPNAPVPGHLRDPRSVGPRSDSGQGGTGSPTSGYQYPHDHPGGFAPQQYLPDELAEHRLYEPTEHGGEAAVARRLDRLRARESEPPPSRPDPASASGEDLQGTGSTTSTDNTAPRDHDEGSHT